MLHMGIYYNHHSSPQSESEKTLAKLLKEKGVLWVEQKGWKIHNHPISNNASGHHDRGIYLLFMEEKPSHVAVVALLIKFEKKGEYRCGSMDWRDQCDLCVGIVIFDGEKISLGKIKDPAPLWWRTVHPHCYKHSDLYWYGCVEGWKSASLLEYENGNAVLKIRENKLLSVTLAPEA